MRQLNLLFHCGDLFYTMRAQSCDSSFYTCATRTFDRLVWSKIKANNVLSVLFYLCAQAASSIARWWVKHAIFVSSRSYIDETRHFLLPCLFNWVRSLQWLRSCPMSMGWQEKLFHVRRQSSNLELLRTFLLLLYYISAIYFTAKYSTSYSSEISFSKVISMSN